MPATLVDANNIFTGGVPDRTVDSVCPYCGVGCLLTYHRQGRQARPTSPDATDPRTRTGYASRAASVLTTCIISSVCLHPLIRKEACPSTADDIVASVQSVDAFPAGHLGTRRSTLPSNSLRDIRDKHGPKALAGFGSAKASNEEA